MGQNLQGEVKAEEQKKEDDYFFRIELHLDDCRKEIVKVREKPDASLCKQVWRKPPTVPAEHSAAGMRVKGLKRAVRSCPVVPPTRNGGGAAPSAR